MQLVDSQLHRSTNPHTGGYAYTEGFLIQRMYDRSRAADVRGLAMVMVLEGLHSWMSNRMNNWYLDRAMQECAAQRGQNPSGCGCCSIEMTIQWEYPASSGRFMLFGDMVYNPPGGRSWLVNARGFYRRGAGACEKAREDDRIPVLRAYDPGKTYRTVHVDF
jgi:hypothetical protein